MTESFYIPYVMLHKSPITFNVGKVPVTLSLLCDAQTCLLTLPLSFKMVESSQSSCTNSSHVRIGSSFTLEYKGLECEVRLGRRIISVEGDEHILL
jgi:hypothetical protein